MSINSCGYSLALSSHKISPKVAIVILNLGPSHAQKPSLTSAIILLVPDHRSVPH